MMSGLEDRLLSFHRNQILSDGFVDPHADPNLIKDGLDQNSVAQQSCQINVNMSSLGHQVPDIDVTDEGSWSTMVNSIDKHGKKCLMISAKATWVIDDKNSDFESSQEPRNTYEDYYTCYVNVKDVALAHILVYEWCESDGSGVTRGTCNATICNFNN
nr:protein kinase domain, nitrogen network kinase 1, phloem protein 2-like protein [Tanacetum cinerariifolium]